MNKNKALVKERDRPMFEAQQIHPETEDWTVLIQVMERRKHRKSRANTDFRNYNATDMKGTKIQLVAFGRDVWNFEDTLLPHNRYKVSNAIVKITPPIYKVLEYAYTWTIHKKILIEPYPDAVPHPLPCAFTFDKFSDFYLYADQPRDICIKAMIVHAFPVQIIKNKAAYRDHIVINEEMIPITLHVWEDLLEDLDVNMYADYKNPTLIVAYGLKVTTHNCLALGTKEYVYFMQNPPLNETCPLKDWYLANSEEVKKLVDTHAYRDSALLFHPPRLGEILSLDHALATIENVKTVWTEGTVSLVPGQTKLWLKACEKCYTEVSAGANWNIWCKYCKEHTDIIVRGTVIVSLRNGARTIQATIKSPDLDKLVPYTPREIMEAAMQGEPLTEKIEETLTGKHLICFLKYYDTQNNGVAVRRYPILKVYTEAEVNAYNINAPLQAAPPQQSATLLIEGSQNEGPSSSNTVAKNNEAQFFSPNTKNVLESILQGLPLDDMHSECSSGVKRMLNFEESPAKGLEANASQGNAALSPTKTPKSEYALPAATAQPCTPNKKSKGKDHED